MPTQFGPIGDLDKPFHRPECECEECEQWRRDKGRQKFDGTYPDVEQHRYKYKPGPPPGTQGGLDG